MVIYVQDVAYVDVAVTVRRRLDIVHVDGRSRVFDDSVDEVLDHEKVSAAVTRLSGLLAELTHFSRACIIAGKTE